MDADLQTGQVAGATAVVEGGGEGGEL